MESKESIWMKGDEEDRLDRLRRLVEDRMTFLRVDPVSLSVEEARKLIHELQVHQLELEIQNEELRQAQRELEVSREHFLKLFHMAPVGYVVLDEAGLMVRVNDTFSRMMGGGEREIVGRPLSRFIMEPDRELFLMRYRAIFKDPAGKCMDARISRLDGSTFHARVEGAAVASAFSGFPAEDGPLLLLTLSDDTEKVEAERSLREAHNRLHSIIEFLPDATFVIDESGKVIAWNRAIEEMTGVLKKDILGKGNHEQALPFYGERRPLLADYALSAELGELDKDDERYGHFQMSGGVVFGEMYASQTFGGKGASLWGAATVLRDPSGKVSGAVESIRDVSGRKMMEEALLREGKRFRNLLDSFPMGIYLANDRYEIEYANPVLIKDFGPVGEQDTCHGYFHGRSEPCPWCRSAEVFSGETLSSEWFSEETGKTYDMVNTPVYGTTGRISRMEVLVDVSARKETERRLQLFKLLAANGRDIILFMCRDDGRLLEANEAAVHAYGYTRDELKRMKVKELRLPHDQGLTAEQMEAADTQGILFETVHVRKDGSAFPVEVSSRGADIDGVRTLISVIRDITERKQAETAMRNSLEEKVALLKEVHHRVKNNLQIVVSLLGLQANCTENSQALEILADTRNRVRSMALLHELLYRSGNLACISFSTYIGDLSKQIAASFGKAAERVRMVIRVEEVQLMLDQAVPCGLIVNELVSNALKHAFPNERPGLVVVELGRVSGKMLLLKVSDNGIGIPPGIDPLSTNTLGLQLVLDLAVQLDGQMALERPLEGGTIFSVAFPVHEDTH